MENTIDRVSARLIKKIKHNKEVYSFEFESKDIKQWKAGDSSKIFMLVEDKVIGKKFSYATSQNENRIIFTTRIKEEKSPYKESLNDLLENSVIELSLPEGDYSLRREDRPLLLLSNGVGLAANRSLIKSYQEDNSKIPEVISINVDSSGEIYKNEFDEIMLNTPFTSFYTKHRQGFYTTLDAQINHLKGKYNLDPYYYIVGSNDFIMGCAGHLKNKGIEDESIITDAHVSTDMPECTCGKQTYCGCNHEPIEHVDLTGKFVLPVL